MKLYYILSVLLIFSCTREINLRNEVYIPYMVSSRPDPLNIIYSGDWIVTNHLWSGLFDLKFDGTLEPVLAESWTRSVDGKTWEIILRKDLKWSDGTLMTISQIIDSLQTSQRGTSHTDLSNIIKSIEAEGDRKIIFKLKQEVPQFLESLTYSDWSIVHPQTVTEKNGKFFIDNYSKLSGPFILDQTLEESKIVKNIKLKLNQNHHFSKNLKLKNGIIHSFEGCDELTKNLDSIASFRLFHDDLTPECDKKLKDNNFNIYASQPTWIIKADFTPHAMKNLDLNSRLNIIVQLQEKLKNDFSKIGSLRATGLRASNLYGSLPESEFDQILLKLKKQIHPMKKIKLKLVSMEVWAKWKSFTWLENSFRDLGYDVVVTKLSMADFYKEFANGNIYKDFDLLFFPLGVGDIDPDGSWRIASRYMYPDLIQPTELQLAYLEPNRNTRGELYKNLATKLIENGRYIPLVMNTDFVGVHESLKIKEGTSIRNGTALFDLE